MKVYDKSAFLTGIFCACFLPLFALDILHADWWQWILSIAISAKFLHIGLSESASRRQCVLRENYSETAAALHGKYYLVKTNLPWIITVLFLSIAAVLRFLLDIILPPGVWVVFIILLAFSAIYSIGIDRSIEEHIDARTAADDSDSL